MSASPTLLRLCPLALLLPAISPALEWERTTAEATTAPFQKTLVLQFPFRNDSGNTAQVKSIDTNCDCITASLDKASYAPGEAGILKATFAVGERTGRYERTITVTTSDTAAPAKLTVVIESAEVAVPTPRSVDWVIGSPDTEKTVELVVAQGVRVKFAEHFAINDRFRTRMETIEEGRRYRLHIRPVSTAVSANTAIRMVGDDGAGHRLVVSAYANVK